MSASNQGIKPLNIEEHIVWHAIRLTWVFYLLGALYVVGPAIAWVLLTVLLYRFTQGKRIHFSISLIIWCLCMLLMLITVFIGHINMNLPLPSLIKSVIGWAKGWALLAIFPCFALLNIRKAILVRACMHLCGQTLCILPLMILAPFLSLPGYLYTSPLKFLAAHSFFEVELYGLNAFDGLPRWRLFAPWSPALGLLGNLLFILSFQERNKRWQWAGIIAAVLMIILSKSRMGLLCFFLIPITVWGIANIRHIAILISLAIIAPVAAALVMPSIDIISDARSEIHASRADSSRVRGALERIALERWRNEAPIWGHGVVEKGPHYVEYMPIGSHHSWLGLLFVKGFVGLLALAIPLLVSYAVVLSKVWQQTTLKLNYGLIPLSKPSCVGLSILLLLSLYSLTENLEILAYLYWPGLVILGYQLIPNKATLVGDQQAPRT